MLTIFIFISSSTFYSKVPPFIELVFWKQGLIFLLFYFCCSIVHIIILYKKWGLEFLIKLFLKGRAHNSETAIAGHVNAVLTPFWAVMTRPILKPFDSSNKIKRIWTEFFSLSQSHQSSVKPFQRIVKQKRSGEKALWLRYLYPSSRCNLCQPI